MFKRLRYATNILMGRYRSIEDQLRKERHESAWLHSCLRGILSQNKGSARITEATQMRMITCDQIWIDRPYPGGDLLVMLAQKDQEPPSRLIAAIRAR